MSSRREENEERLNAKVGGKHFFLQGRKGGHREGVVANLGHDETLRQQEGSLSEHGLQELVVPGPPQKTHLVELGADKCAIDQQVIWSCTCELGQSIDETTLKSHLEQSAITVNQ